MTALLYLILGLACFAALLGLTQAADDTEPQD